MDFIHTHKDVFSAIRFLAEISGRVDAIPANEFCFMVGYPKSRFSNDMCNAIILLAKCHKDSFKYEAEKDYYKDKYMVYRNVFGDDVGFFNKEELDKIKDFVRKLQEGE